MRTTRLQRDNGRFVDLRTLAFALRDESLTLESACNAFDVPYTKRPVRYGGINEEMLRYSVRTSRRRPTSTNKRGFRWYGYHKGARITGRQRGLGSPSLERRRRYARPEQD